MIRQIWRTSDDTDFPTKELAEEYEQTQLRIMGLAQALPIDGMSPELAIPLSKYLLKNWNEIKSLVETKM